jgi:N-acyl-phosphatidylethanolamine-hydrolysing phospholipase D
MPSPDTTPPTVTVRRPTFLPSRAASPALRATWLGHACYYVEFGSGLRVLFDPVFEHRCSPFAWLGPQRFTPRPCDIADLPAVDAVVISHSHYDHLSHTSVTEIARAHPRAHFFVGLGLEKWFRRAGIDRVTEMDWWEDVDVAVAQGGSGAGRRPASAASEEVRSLASDPEKDAPAGRPITARISCLPAQHTSGRTGFDRDTTLWCSFAVRSGGQSVFFGGDTGYRAVAAEDDEAERAAAPACPSFAQIGALRGPFDLGLIPIGAYAPRVLFSPMHADPRDAVDIFADTRCRRALGIHWGTWALTTEDVLEPPALLREALRAKGLPEAGVFDVCEIGESREF